jgi:hypothetical protein
MSRLEHEFSALAGTIENAAPNERARIARAAATAAVEAAQVDDDAIVEALTQLTGHARDEGLRGRVEQVARRLDEAHWGAEEGVAPETNGVANPFARARAASSVWFALGENDVSNAQDAVYEAHFVLQGRASPALDRRGRAHLARTRRKRSFVDRQHFGRA